MDTRQGKRLHDTIGFVGLRAQATAVGLLQLTSELVTAGVLDGSALQRIKDRIAHELALNRPPHMPKDEFESQLGLRLDRLFSGEEILQPDQSLSETSV